MTGRRKRSMSSRFKKLFGKSDRIEVDCDNVPAALAPFLDVVFKWGATESDSQRYELRERAEEDPRELKELEDFLRAWTPEIGKVYTTWGKDLSLSENKTLARFYFTFMLIDELSIKLPPDENADHVGELIEQLTEGSSWAAKRLADYGEEAKRAVPQLKAALTARTPKLEIWAHYALARISGDVDKHRAAIKRLGKRYADEESDAERALDWLNRTPEQHNVNALVTFASGNKLRELRRLLAVTQVDSIDSYGHRALEKAVNENHKEAVRILLEHGADPSLKNKWGSSCLHDAALDRDCDILSLLIENGADVNAIDRDGLTPLDCAIRSKRKGNAKLLRQAGAKRGRSILDSSDSD